MRHFKMRATSSTEAKLKCPGCGTIMHNPFTKARSVKWVFDGPHEGQITECPSCQAILEYAEVGTGSLHLRLATELRVRQIREAENAPSPLPRLSTLVEAARHRRPMAPASGVLRYHKN